MNEMAACYFPDATVAAIRWIKVNGIEAAVPGTDLHISPAELQGLRHSYRYLAYTRLKAGGQVSSELLGIDRPDDVKKIYQEAEDWLND